MENRFCRECEEALHGRVDQKFCSDYCRNTFNNRLNADVNVHVRRINAILRKNRLILSKFNPKGKVTLDGIVLAEAGFNFHYFTNVFRTKRGTQYYFCYDQGYVRVENDQYVLVQKQEYVK